MYKAILVQDGEGCDYTIGCGISIIDLHALSSDEAYKELKREVIGEWDEKDGRFYGEYMDEQRLESATLIKVIETIQPDISAWYAEAEKIVENHKNSANVNAEKAELERLKKKYGEV